MCTIASPEEQFAKLSQQFLGENLFGVADRNAGPHQRVARVQAQRRDSLVDFLVRQEEREIRREEREDRFVKAFIGFCEKV